ncbi:S1 family peptidase [Kibdelosporangium philippinense]|uniref:S1 family peptidase n=1 Tax=Kibdelosporangium philippinense TaxID=211113 RepID=A0ABS8ZHN3_9PSEU|nr:S1 family peptidase [Kibdelosporangium philippinense]MCE7006131.1 S1 family peptidase [Kibdelosporangium philippinense]
MFRKNAVLAVAGISILGVLAAPATAAPAKVAYDSGTDAVATIAQAYLKSHPDLSPAKARAAAQAQSAGEDLKAEVSRQWKSFGGGWFDPYTATYHLAVTLASTGKSLAAIGASKGVKVDTPLVARSFDQLNAEAEALRTGTSALAKAAAGNIGVDVQNNQVVAAVPAAARRAELSQAGVAVTNNQNPAVEADACTDRANCDDFLAAGLIMRNGTGQHWCSIGYTARNSANQRITLTAGHCSTGIGENWSNGTAVIRGVGSVSGRIDSGVSDVTRIVSTNAFYGNVNSGRIYIGAGSNTSPVKGKSFFLVNDVACLSASYTNPARAGNPCATVTSTSDAGTRGMVRISGYDACGGDSGGGWYWLAASGNRYATALHSRSNTGCNVANGTSWASPLTAFYSDLTYEIS